MSVFAQLTTGALFVVLLAAVSFAFVLVAAVPLGYAAHVALDLVLFGWRMA